MVGRGQATHEMGWFERIASNFNSLLRLTPAQRKEKDVIKKGFWYYTKLAIFSTASGIGVISISFADESLVEQDARIDATLRATGFQPVYEERCPRRVMGYFTPALPTGNPGIVVCVNNHEGRGDMSHTQAHEMAHAAQYCLASRELVLNDIFDITKLVISEWQETRRAFREIQEQEIQIIRRDQKRCALGMIPNKVYCENLPRRLKQKPLYENPVLARVDAGEKLSLVDLVGSPDLRTIIELYQPKQQYLELEARAFAFLGRDAALKAVTAACKDFKATSRK